MASQDAVLILNAVVTARSVVLKVGNRFVRKGNYFTVYNVVHTNNFAICTIKVICRKC
jgi:hypothetical protein